MDEIADCRRISLGQADLFLDSARLQPRSWQFRGMVKMNAARGRHWATRFERNEGEETWLSSLQSSYLRALERAAGRGAGPE